MSLKLRTERKKEVRVIRVIKSVARKTRKALRIVKEVTWNQVGSILIDLGIAIAVLAFAYLIATGGNTTNAPTWVSNTFNAIGNYLGYIVLGIVMALVILSFKKARG